MSEIEPPSQKAQRVLGILAAAILEGEIQEGRPQTFLSYSTVLDRMNVPRTWKRAGLRLKHEGLEDLAYWTESHDELPKADALIVNQRTRRPGAGFSRIHKRNQAEAESWWLDQANRAINYDWSPFLPFTGSYRPIFPVTKGVRLREEEEAETPAYKAIITTEPAPAHIRRTSITVRDILIWLASGQTDGEIMKRHPDLSRKDIQASLAYAADRERQVTEQKRGVSRLSTVASRWGGKFELPQPDPNDSRSTYLIERYLRHRK